MSYYSLEVFVYSTQFAIRNSDRSNRRVHDGEQQTGAGRDASLWRLARVQVDYGYNRGYFCCIHARSSRRSSLCGCVCLSLCVFVWFSACELTGKRRRSGYANATQTRPTWARFTRPEAQLSSLPLPSLPIPQASTITSEVLPLHCVSPPRTPSPPSRLAPDWLGGRGGGGVVFLSGWQRFQARSDWRARPQIRGQQLPAPPSPSPTLGGGTPS